MTNWRYWVEDNFYVIGGDTYNIKDDFKTVPGYQWNNMRKVWLLPRVEMALEIIRKHRIPQRVKVRRDAFCHEPEADIYISENEILPGDFLAKDFCSLCDSHWRNKIKVTRL